VKEPAWLGCGLVFGVAAAVGIAWNRHSDFWEAQESKPLVVIAMIGQNRDAHVKELLGAHRILVVTWGGSHSGYWVQVPEWQAERAILLLLQDAKEQGYSVHFGDHHVYSHSDAEWINPSVNVPYQELLDRPQYGEATEVGACLRRAEVATEAKAYSKIRRVRYSCRLLWEAVERSPLIQEILLEGSSSSREGVRRYSEVQILSLGGKVHCFAHSWQREE